MIKRNMNDAILRAKCDPLAEVHLHVDEVADDLCGLKAQWQAEALESVVAKWKAEIPTERVIQYVADLASELREKSQNAHD